ncbi:FluG domain-containing protein [Blastomyces dermatitidis ER-3]|uniref:FluG domain-containing protein n=2 Tax=Ajellomyces dermatitidis TaxID=5039 RepID=F2TGH7_AJEDA|nr:FluG domain-containing protein [Blastomyces dermatitidis ER-3]EEQ88960.2 FluG domain-containing protein [Blastomyces dermatitidis ER-3]EGE82318.2 FluG domain-containing protein [Blastomyces dermatitidis ATCC 18188]
MVAQLTHTWNSRKPIREGRRDRKTKGHKLTPGEYRERDITRVAQLQITGKKYADATTISINRVHGFWGRHCEFMKVDAHRHLAICVAENFRVYIDWRLKNFSIKKQSTIWVEWKFLRLLFKREIGRKVDKLAGEQISEFVLGPLTDEYDLDLSIKFKLVVGVEDLVAILHYQLVLRYSICHPRMIYRATTAAYANDRLHLLATGDPYREWLSPWVQRCPLLQRYHAGVIPNPDQPDQHVLVMEVSLLYMKGKTTYIFHEQDDNLAICPVSHFLALALAADTFEARGISSIEDVFRIQVQAPRNSIQLKSKSNILDVPVFHRAVRTAQGVRISPDRTLPYDTFNQYLQRLGRNAGFEHKLTPYCIRRGTANAVDSIATTSERNQVMGHSRADIFERYYILQKVKWDVQSAYIGCPARESIINAVGRFSLTRDPRVPKELSDEQKAAVERDPRLVKLSGQHQSLAKLINRKHGSIPKAKGTALHREYIELGDDIRAEKPSLYREAFDRMREEFFATIDTIEIEKQLLGLSGGDKFKGEDESSVKFTFKERARLAQNLFRSSDCTTEAPHEIYARRVQTIQDWVSLCSLQEGTRRRKALYSSCGFDIDQADGIIDADTFPILCPGTQCLFCLGDSQLPHSSRMYSFSRPDHLRRHVQDCHLQYHNANTPLWCPHPSCLEVLDGVKHFKEHAILTHNIHL